MPKVARRRPRLDYIGFRIDNEVFGQLLRALPTSCVNLEVDTDMSNWSPQKKPHHVCSDLWHVLPQMRHVKLRMQSLCSRMLYINHEDPDDRATQTDMTCLDQLDEQRIVKADQLPANLAATYRAGAFPKAVQLEISQPWFGMEDQENDPQRKERAQVYRNVMLLRDCMADKTLPQPLRRIDGDGEMLAFYDKTDTCMVGKADDLLQYAEYSVWRETSYGARMPCCTDSVPSDVRLQATPSFMPREEWQKQSDFVMIGWREGEDHGRKVARVVPLPGADAGFEIDKMPLLEGTQIGGQVIDNHINNLVAHILYNVSFIVARQERPPAVVRPAATLHLSVAGPDAIPLGLMVSTYTLEDLNKEGYINYPVESTVTELDLAFGYGAILRQAEEQKGHHRPGEPYHIHPCLQRSHWKNMNEDEDWEAILPSVELASRFLHDPGITPFFAGLADNNVRNLDDPIHQKTHNREFAQWEFDNTVGKENNTAIENALFAMMAFRKWIVLGFEMLEDCHGLPGWSDAEQKCVIGLDIRFLLAAIIIREIAHCAWKIHALDTGTTELAEAYLRDRPTNELGYEVEKMVFSGLIRASGKKNHASASYGMIIAHYPGPNNADDDNDLEFYPRGLPRDWNQIWCTEYPVHMGLCKRMFTKNFWDGEVARYGLAACRPERKKGVRGYFKKIRKVDPSEAGLSPKSLALHHLTVDRRNQKIRAAVRADDINRSDTEDEEEDGFVIRGRHKRAVELAEGDEDGDVPMADAL
ncbi:hypothetical protein KCU83_g3958, partial [Aureobasidium melanogenum]